MTTYISIISSKIWTILVIVVFAFSAGLATRMIGIYEGFGDHNTPFLAGTYTQNTLLAGAIIFAMIAVINILTLFIK
jgi:hypothetical protein